MRKLSLLALLLCSAATFGQTQGLMSITAFGGAVNLTIFGCPTWATTGMTFDVSGTGIADGGVFVATNVQVNGPPAPGACIHDSTTTIYYSDPGATNGTATLQGSITVVTLPPPPTTLRNNASANSSFAPDNQHISMNINWGSGHPSVIGDTLITVVGYSYQSGGSVDNGAPSLTLSTPNVTWIHVGDGRNYDYPLGQAAPWFIQGFSYYYAVPSVVIPGTAVTHVTGTLGPTKASAAFEISTQLLDYSKTFALSSMAKIDANQIAPYTYNPIHCGTVSVTKSGALIVEAASYTSSHAPAGSGYTLVPDNNVTTEIQHALDVPNNSYTTNFGSASQLSFSCMTAVFQ